jgi:hypothetical protein
MPSDRLRDDPTRGFHGLDEFSASMPDVSRHQAEAIWEYFRAPQSSDSKGSVLDSKQIGDHTGRLRRRALVAARWAIFLWTGTLVLSIDYRNVAVLLGFVAYCVSTVAVDAHCRSRLDPSAIDLSHQVIWILAGWAAFTIVLLEIARLDGSKSITGLLGYAKTHGWFVAALFLWCFVCTIFLFNKVRNARSKALWAAYPPLLCFLVLMVVHEVFPKALPSDGSGYYYFVGAIVVGYISIVFAVIGSNEFKQRFERRRPPTIDS